MRRGVLLSVLRLLLRRRAARLEHLLHEVEPHPCLGLVLRDGEVVVEVKVSHVGGVGVAVLVGGPLELGRVCVARADVLGLEVLQLGVDVVPFAAHLGSLGRSLDDL